MILILFKHSNKNKLYLLKAKSMKNFVIKRTIMSRLYGQGHHGVKTVGNYANPNRISKIRKDIHYHVDDATAMSSSHELAQRNPILKKAWKKGPIDNSFQHSVIGRDKCEISSCKDKICNRPCGGQITERVYVGHVTHSNQYGIFVSYNDFNNKSDKQYFVPYIPPVPNMDISGDNINKDRTDNLNTKNTEARTMIHLYTKENIDHDS